MAPKKSSIRFIDLCCGAGGFTQGLHQAGLHHVLGVDFDARVGPTYEANHGAGTFLNASVRDADLVARIRERAGPGARIDLVAGSPPCQTFSSAYMHTGKHGRAPVAQDLLALEVVRVAAELRAPLVLIENVPGMGRKACGALCGGSKADSKAGGSKAAGGGGARTVLDLIYARMRAAGYEPEHRVINLAYLGVPQARKRLFVLGVARRLSAAAAAPFPWPPLREPGPAQHAGRHLLPPTSPLLRAPPNGYDVWLGPAKVRYYLDRFAHPQLRQFVGLVNPDAPARTVRAGYHKNRGAEALLGYDARGRLTTEPERVVRMRMLTTLECQRLQSFPDSFRFVGPVGNHYKQIGNAVPPRGAEAIGRALAAFLQR